MTICRYNVLVCNQPLKPTQPPISVGWEMSTGQWTVAVVFGHASQMLHYIYLREFYNLIGLIKGDGYPAYTALWGVTSFTFECM